MKKKITIVLCGLILLGLIFYGVNIYNNSLGDGTVKNVTIKIQNTETTVLDDSFKTNAGTLEELLIELSNDGVIKLEYEDSEYGMYIKGLGKDELFKESLSENMFWIFDSENNKTCKENEFCPAASSLEINDGDIFTFSLIKYE